MSDARPILILGGGINGAAVARELAVNGLPVVLVDQVDLASGATAYSSRLIHGGLRYLEYGEFALVRESLRERTRLLRLAPRFVRPLELFVPTTNRIRGLAASAARMVGLERWARPPKRGRGAWLVGCGLWFYDVYAQDPTLPRHRSLRTARGAGVPVDPRRYPWQSAYFDAQIRFPERFVVALLADGARAAAQRGERFEVRTYHAVQLDGEVAHVRGPAGDVVATFRPALVINATGAWVDRTLRALEVAERKLIGGTKGSHFLTWHAGLRAALGPRGIYAEASDGRPVFILPFGDATLVGTTDEVFEADPATAVATEEELDYLLAAVNGLLPQFALARGDIEQHYCGVRPLPVVDRSRPAAITRRHWVEVAAESDPLVMSLVGGKLTTCRSLAEEVGDAVLARLGRERTASTRDRPLPGAEHEEAVERASLTPAQRQAVVEQEWVERLSDLVERRLMLVFKPRLTRGDLFEAAQLLARAGKLAPERVEGELDGLIASLAARHGKRVEP